VLGRGPIGATANFWDLGGNSLAAVRILQEILHVTGKALSPERFYRAPSIRQQAALVEEAATSAFGSHA
jgi:acyl carrier protein